MKKTTLMNWLLLSVLLLSFASPAFGELNAGEIRKREEIRNTLEKGILSPYSIPFEVYANLKMWDEMEGILRANTHNANRYRLPGVYYSRPFLIDGKIWIFENPTVTGGAAYLFEPETLDLADTIQKIEYSRFDGGVRTVFRSTVISGGSDKDVDTAVLWDTESGEIRTVKLLDGHYIGAIQATGDRLYIGSCGGLVNVWNMEDLGFSQILRTSREQTEDWADFNQKACITALLVIDGSIAGAGGEEIFLWEGEELPLKSFKKALAGDSLVYFHNGDAVVYGGNQAVLQDLRNGSALRRLKTDLPIEDLIVTDEKLLPDQRGELLILSMRHNKGIRIYDYETFDLLEKMNVAGETLAAAGNAIFATDDRHLYRYSILGRNLARFEEWLGTIRKGEIRLGDERYSRVLAILSSYPDILVETGIVADQLAAHSLHLSHSFKYGKIGQGEVGLYGYKAVYEMENRSDNRYLVTLNLSWSGQYGRTSLYEPRARHPLRPQSFFIEPGRGRTAGSFDVGEKEPEHFILYPETILTVTADYQQGLTKALSAENEDLALVEKYLADEKVRQWHPELKAQKERLGQEVGLIRSLWQRAAGIFR